VEAPRGGVAAAADIFVVLALHARGNAVIATENESNVSKNTVKIFKEWQSITVNDSVE
jgi:hypothetical protein